MDSAGLYYPINYAYNIDSVGFYGVEGEFNGILFDKLVIFGNYSYREMNYDKGALPSAFLLDLPPKHKANLGLRYRLLKDTLITSDLRYVGERKSEGGYTFDEYFIMDLGIEQTFFKKAKFGPLKILAFVNNLFGESYQEVYGYPMPYQTFGVQVKFTF